MLYIYLSYTEYLSFLSFNKKYKGCHTWNLVMKVIMNIDLLGN